MKYCKPILPKNKAFQFLPQTIDFEHKHISTCFDCF